VHQSPHYPDGFLPWSRAARRETREENRRTGGSVVGETEHDLRRPVPPRRHVLRHEALLTLLTLRGGILVKTTGESEVADLELAVGVDLCNWGVSREKEPRRREGRTRRFPGLRSRWRTWAEWMYCFDGRRSSDSDAE
jgi:hypothetical protein